MTSKVVAGIDLLELADRVEALKTGSNAVDVLVEVALFKPNKFYKAVRPNAAGTKVIYTRRSGEEVTHFSGDHTLRPGDRQRTATALRARASLIEGGGE